MSLSNALDFIFRSRIITPKVNKCLFCDSVLQSLTRLKSRNLCSLDLDFFLCLRIDTRSCSTSARLESTKAYELRLVALCECFGDNLGQSIKSLAGIFLCKFGFLSYCRNEFCFCRFSFS